MDDAARSPYLAQAEAGAFLGLSPRTLERFRVEGRGPTFLKLGPTFLKLGRRVLYARADLVRWAEAQRRSSTADGGAARRGRRDRGQDGRVAHGLPTEQNARSCAPRLFRGPFDYLNC
jgi:Helix-turn-helix domain